MNILKSDEAKILGLSILGALLAPVVLYLIVAFSNFVGLALAGIGLTLAGIAAYVCLKWVAVNTFLLGKDAVNELLDIGD